MEQMNFPLSTISKMSGTLKNRRSTMIAIDIRAVTVEAIMALTTVLTGRIKRVPVVPSQNMIAQAGRKWIIDQSFRQ